MSPLMMLLAFMLPLLTAATQNLTETDLYTLFSSDPAGDVLNVTQCYCGTDNLELPDARFGYYYVIDYWNYHSNRTYSITKMCNVQLTIADAKCIYHLDDLEKICQDNPDGGDQFCFKFEEDLYNDVNHTKPSKSEYWFGKQKRVVPKHPSRFLPLYNVTRNCGFYCNLAGLGTSNESYWFVPWLGHVANNIVSYEYLDDMCDTCA